MLQADLNVILPEILLAIFALLALVVAAYTGKDKVAGPLTWITAIVFVLVGLWIAVRDVPGTAFHGMYNADGFTTYCDVVILFSAAAVLIMGQEYMARRKILNFEYPVIVVLAVIGMMVMAAAGDLIALYLGLELQSLALYVVASIRRDSVKSTEAGLKYYVLGSLASGLVLYGASLIYGFSGTTEFSGIVKAATNGHASLGLLFGIVFMICGMGFKISAVPFHMWTPDVYDGAPTPVAAFFSTAPKVAAMAMIARVLYDAFGNVTADWQQITAVISVASMFLGSIAAIGQTNIKRLMAYSSIAHMGYALMGLSSGTVFGVQAMLIYMAFYATMNVGTFAFILTMEKDGKPITDISALKMYSKTNPGRALAVLFLMFSLAGVPPFLGFFGKIYVLTAAYQGGLIWLAVMAVIASVIGAFYYLRIVYFMYFAENNDPLETVKNPVLGVIMWGASALVLLGAFNLFGLEGVAQAAAQTLVH